MRPMRTRRGSWSLLQRGEEAGGRGSRKLGLREDTQLLLVCQGDKFRVPYSHALGAKYQLSMVYVWIGQLSDEEPLLTAHFSFSLSIRKGRC